MLTTILCAAALLGGPLCLPNPNSTGLPAHLEVTLAESGDVVDVLTEQMQPANRAIVFYGTLPMDPIPWGQGELCLHPLYRYRGPSSIANADGRTLDTMSVQALPPGTVYFQTLYRDFGGSTFNLSNLAEIGVALGSTNPEPGSGSEGMTLEQQSFCGDDQSGGAGLYLPLGIWCPGDPPYISNPVCDAACADAYREATQEEQAEACECLTGADETRQEAIDEAWATFLLGPCNGDFGDMDCTSALYAAIDAANAGFNIAAATCESVYAGETVGAYNDFAACRAACCE